MSIGGPHQVLPAPRAPMPQYHGLEVFVPQNDRPHIE